MTNRLTAMHRTSVLLGTVLNLCLIGSTNLYAQIRLPSVIGNNMVLQRGIEAPVWGWALPGQAISVEASWEGPIATTQANENGRWMVRLPEAEAGGPHTIQITGEETINLTNVMIGEVWICSGQSNMEWPMTRVDGFAQEIAEADYPKIRLFNMVHAVATSPQTDCKGSWSVCSPQTVQRFSAVGYFFGRELHQELDVPIGLIGTNWGGTRVEAWTTENTLREFPELHDELDQLAVMRNDPASVERMQQEAEIKWWTNLMARDAGSGDQNWANVDTHDSAWPTMSLPGQWEQTELGAFDGIVWFRKSFELPADLRGRDLVLELGPIDDMDTTYVNGRRVGGFEIPGYWQEHRKFMIRASALKPGTNTIAVRVIDTGGAGGFVGSAEQMKLGKRDGLGSTVELAGEWKYQTGPPMSELGRWPNNRPLHANSASALYNGMIAPLVPYGIRGAIWYQGESNVSNAYTYRTRFPAMIRDWRKAWAQATFPFYFVQIAPFAYGGDQGEAAELREAQLMAMSMPNVGMAVTMDIGNPRNIHPTNKKDVGNRLARWALAKDYGKEVVFSGPVYRSMRIEGSKVRLLFDHAAEGLLCKGDSFTHFTIAAADQKFVEAEARIDGDSILVSAAGIKSPVAVRFAWGAADEPNLFNGAGLPASSFRTDDWPGITEPKK